MDKKNNISEQEKSTPPYEEWEDWKVVDVKKEVNALIWEHAPENLTLGEAEDRACTIFNMIRQYPTKGGDAE